jgi:hypothetical protein
MLGEPSLIRIIPAGAVVHEGGVSIDLAAGVTIRVQAEPPVTLPNES